MATSGFYKETNNILSKLGIADKLNTPILDLISSYQGQLVDCTPPFPTCVGIQRIISTLQYIANETGNLTFNQIVTRSRYFSILDSAQEIFDTFIERLDESKNFYVSPLNAENTDTWEYTISEVGEQTSYWEYVNTFTSGLVDGTGVNPLNDINDLVSGKFAPLFKFSASQIADIVNMKLKLDFWSVELGSVFSSGIYSVKIFKEISGTITEVGTVSTINLGATVPVGNARTYYFNFEIPQDVKNSIFDVITFNATITDGVTNWSEFIDTVSNIVNPAETVNYYVGLVTDTVSASGGAFINVNLQTIFNSTGSNCETTCGGTPEERYIGLGCVGCKSTVNSSSFWTT